MPGSLVDVSVGAVSAFHGVEEEYSADYTEWVLPELLPFVDFEEIEFIDHLRYFGVEGFIVLADEFLVALEVKIDLITYLGNIV